MISFFFLSFFLLLLLFFFFFLVDIEVKIMSVLCFGLFVSIFILKREKEKVLLSFIYLYTFNLYKH
jgi:hypothetical protein